MKTIINELYNDNKTKEELIDNIAIARIEYNDILDVLFILQKTFHIPTRDEAFNQIYSMSADLPNSVKVFDKRDNKIYGILIFACPDITRATPILNINNTLGSYLKNKNMVNGFAFVLDKRLRGTTLDKQMLMFNKLFLSKYDYIWCGVERELLTDNYWKRLGFKELINTPQATFYLRPLKQKEANDIFIIKLLSENIYETNSINRETGASVN